MPEFVVEAGREVLVEVLSRQDVLTRAQVGGACLDPTARLETNCPYGQLDQHDVAIEFSKQNWDAGTREAKAHNTSSPQIVQRSFLPATVPSCLQDTSGSQLYVALFCHRYIQTAAGWPDRRCPEITI